MLSIRNRRKSSGFRNSEVPVFRGFFFNEHIRRIYGTFKMVRFSEDSGFQRVRFSEFLLYLFLAKKNYIRVTSCYFRFCTKCDQFGKQHDSFVMYTIPIHR
jgi:hypothetical protein